MSRHGRQSEMGTRQEKREFAHNSIVLLLCDGSLASGRELTRAQTFGIFWHLLASFLLKTNDTRRQ